MSMYTDCTLLLPIAYTYTAYVFWVQLCPGGPGLQNVEPWTMNHVIIEMTHLISVIIAIVSNE